MKLILPCKLDFASSKGTGMICKNLKEQNENIVIKVTSSAKIHAILWVADKHKAELKTLWAEDYGKGREGSALGQSLCCAGNWGTVVVTSPNLGKPRPPPAAASSLADAVILGRELDRNKAPS